MGRKPKTNKLIPCTVMLQKSDIDRIDAIAKRYGVRRGILLRTVVLDRIIYFDNCKKDIDISFLKE